MPQGVVAGVGAVAGVARVLGLEAVAVAPTALVLAAGLRSPGVLFVAAGCLALGYLILRLPQGRPVAEGTWLGLSIGGGLGLANAMSTQELAGLCSGLGCGPTALVLLRSWLIAVVATSGIGLAAGFLASYERAHRAARAALGRAVAATGPRDRFARLK